MSTPDEDEPAASAVAVADAGTETDAGTGAWFSAASADPGARPGVASIWPSRPRVVPASVPGEPVLRGAMLAAVAQARTTLLASVADPQ